MIVFLALVVRLLQCLTYCLTRRLTTKCMTTSQTIVRRYLQQSDYQFVLLARVRLSDVVRQPILVLFGFWLKLVPQAWNFFFYICASGPGGTASSSLWVWPLSDNRRSHISYVRRLHQENNNRSLVVWHFLFVWHCLTSYVVIFPFPLDLSDLVWLFFSFC